jgi:hypothetical protein
MPSSKQVVITAAIALAVVVAHAKVTAGGIPGVRTAAG